MKPVQARVCSIGVFDSGVGGLSVLRALRKALPVAELLYFADSGHAPYGERDAAFVAARSLAIAGFLRQHGARLLVVACNTATAAAVQALRTAHADWPIVGVEPGVKPAVALTRNGRVGVMATAGTLRSERFGELVRQHAGGVQLITQPCTGLASCIERGRVDGRALGALLDRHTQPLVHAGCDVVVLGCTHYAFVAAPIQQRLGQGVQLLDTAEAVARRAATLAAQLQPPEPGTREDTDARPGVTRLWGSGDVAKLDAFARRHLGLPAGAQHADPA